MGILMLHRIGYDLDQLEEAGCQLAKPPEMFKALMLATNGDPCTTGCAFFDGGKCSAYLKHHSVPEKLNHQKQVEHKRSHTDQSGLIGGKWAGMSIKKIAQAERISINEAQRRKNAGAYQV